MISKLKQNGSVVYGVIEFVCDTPEDLPKLPKDAAMGSTVFVISIAKTYMKNSSGEWAEIG